MYPDDSVQSLTRDWWIADQSGALSRGRLLWTFVPYPEMKPYRLIPEGRGDDARQHTRANFRIEPFRIGDPLPPTGTLPVAALPLRDGEIYYVQRGKVRPAVVISVGGTDVPREIRQGQHRWQSTRSMLVAPFYGAEPGGSRGGWPAPFVERIRRAEYPQYVWDKLPLGGGTESILRLDHMFPIGSDPAAYRLESVKLSDEALTFLDEWIIWLVTGSLPTDSILGMVREGFSDL